jgi:chromosome segregation ATPase
MKTIEELEAELETVTRERDEESARGDRLYELTRELIEMVEVLTRERDLSLAAWEAAGMTGRDAKSAMLELARQLEEAQRERDRACEMVELQNARLDQHHGSEARMERERDEARAEAKELRGILHVAGERLKACSYGLTEFSYQEMASVLFDLPRNTEEPTNG